MRPASLVPACFSAALSAAAVALLSTAVPWPQTVTLEAATAARTGPQPALAAPQAPASFRAAHRPAPVPSPSQAPPRVSYDLESATLIRPATVAPSRAPSGAAPQGSRGVAGPSPSASYADLPSSSGAYGSAQAYAEALVGAAQFACLKPLWERESGWNPYASNPGSGAYGIPQALPGSKMASAGPDWQTNPDTQVRWGVSYVNSVYGSACGAWEHEQETGWY